MKYDSDTLREIELLQRKQQRSIAEMLEDPDNEEARQHFRRINAQVRALRMQLSTQKEKAAP